jgi:hypothetical protein
MAIKLGLGSLLRKYHQPISGKASELRSLTANTIFNG